MLQLVLFGNIKSGWVNTLHILNYSYDYDRLPPASNTQQKIPPSEFKHWIKAHNNNDTTPSYVPATTKLTRKKSILSTVSSYTEEDSNGSDSSSSSDDEDPITPTEGKNSASFFA
jgi:hypothetical protein